MDNQFTFCVCTYNSSEILHSCLRSIKSLSANSRLIVIGHGSQDGTIEIAEDFEAEIYDEEMGLGHARQKGPDLAKTDYIVFVDSDAEIVRRDFLAISERVLSDGKFGAIVGMSVGHKLTYGLPASLLALRMREFKEKMTIPDYIDAREIFFIQRRLDELKLKTVYVLDAIRHRSQFRQHKPEWEGPENTRILPSPPYKELPFALKVTILLSFNSGSLKNVFYIPIFYLKFLKGFANPKPWLRLRREIPHEAHS